MLDISKCTIFAKKQLEKRNKIPVCMIIFSSLISYLFTFAERKISFIDSFLKAGSKFSEETYSKLYQYFYNNLDKVYIILGILILSFLISSIIEYSETRVLIKMSHSPEPVNFMDFINGFSKAVRAILTYLWVFIVLFAGMFVIALLASMLFLVTKSFSLYYVSILFLFVYVIYKSVEFKFAYYISVEFEHIKITQITGLSKKITYGAKWSILKTIIIYNLPLILFTMILTLAKINLNFIVESIITLIFNCIFIPRMTMILINIFHSQLKDKIEAKILLPEVFEK